MEVLCDARDDSLAEIDTDVDSLAAIDSDSLTDCEAE